MNRENKPAPKPQASGRSAYSTWLPLLVLVTLTLVTQLASVAYTSAQSFSAIFLPSTVAILVVTTPLAAVGLWLGARIGLGAPLISALLSRSPGAGRRLARHALQAIGLGLVVGMFLWMLRIVSLQFLPPELPELGHRGATGGLLVSISAAIGEEVWFRLGVMLILARLILRLLGQTEL